MAPWVGAEQEEEHDEAAGESVLDCPGYGGTPAPALEHLERQSAPGPTASSTGLARAFSRR